MRQSYETMVQGERTPSILMIPSMHVCIYRSLGYFGVVIFCHFDSDDNSFILASLIFATCWLRGEN